MVSVNSGNILIIQDYIYIYIRKEIFTMITKTIDVNKATALFFNLNTEEVEKENVTFTGDFTTRKDNNRVFLKLKDVTTETAKYSMDDDKFIVLASEYTTKDRNVRYVTRTFKDTNATCLYMDIEKMEITKQNIRFKGDKSIDDVNAIMSKGKYEGSLKYLKTESVDYLETVFFIKETDMIEHGTKEDE